MSFVAKLKLAAAALVAAGVLGVAVKPVAAEEAKPEAQAKKQKPIVYEQWPFDATEAKKRQKETAEALSVPVERAVDLGGGVKLELALIPAGEFDMGRPEDYLDGHGHPSSKTLHRVRITQPFWIGRYELTQEAWEKVMGSNPSKFKGARNPVERTSWNDCQEFLKKLNGLVKEKGEFRLPTSAQWEYACRAGTKTAFYCGETISKEQANFGGSRKTTTPVDSFPPNAWGLHDCHGNVMEWCSDLWAWDKSAEDYWKISPKDDPPGPATGNLRVLRGGEFGHGPIDICSPALASLSPEDGGSHNFGCRVMCTIGGK